MGIAGATPATAAGMAKQGLVPVLAVYSAFSARAMICCCMMWLSAGSMWCWGWTGPDWWGADGETHHGCFDVMYLSQVPGMKGCSVPPALPKLRTMPHRAVQEETGPVAVRYPRGGEGAYQEDRSDEAIACLRPGTDITLLTYGTLINEAPVRRRSAGTAGYLRSGAEAPAPSLLSPETVRTALTGTKRLLVLEDCVETGCVGQRVAAVMAQLGMAPPAAGAEKYRRRFIPPGQWRAASSLRTGR